MTLLKAEQFIQKNVKLHEESKKFQESKFLTLKK